VAGGVENRGLVRIEGVRWLRNLVKLEGSGVILEGSGVIVKHSTDWENEAHLIHLIYL